MKGCSKKDKVSLAKNVVMEEGTKDQMGVDSKPNQKKVYSNWMIA